MQRDRRIQRHRSSRSRGPSDSEKEKRGQDEVEVEKGRQPTRSFACARSRVHIEEGHLQKSWEEKTWTEKGITRRSYVHGDEERSERASRGTLGPVRHEGAEIKEREKWASRGR